MTSSVANPTPRLQVDLLQVVLTVLILMQVWRVQGLIRGTPLYGVPVIATVVTLGLLLLDRDPQRRLARPSQPVVRAALGILVLVVLSIPGSLYPARSVTFLLKDYLRSVVLMLLVAASVRGLTDLRRLAWVQIIGVTLSSAIIVTSAQIGREGRLDAEGTYYDANDLAALIVCTLPLVLYAWRRPTGTLGRLLLAAITVFLMTTLGRTGSRGGFLGFLVVAGYLLLRFRGISKAKRLGAVALLVVLLVTLASDRYFARIETLLHPSADYNWSGRSETGRVEIWKRGISYMVSHPVLGVGAAAFPRAEGTLSPEARERQRYGRSFQWSTAHNSFILIGAELGVLGVVFLLMLLLDAFRMLARIRRGPPGAETALAEVLSASLAGFVVTAFFLSEAYSAYLYTLLGMALGLARVAPAVARGVASQRPPGRWGGVPSGALPFSGGLSRGPQ